MCLDHVVHVPDYWFDVISIYDGSMLPSFLMRTVRLGKQLILDHYVPTCFVQCLV